MALEPLNLKWQAFGWEIATVNNGHDFEEIDNALQKISHSLNPKVLILNTIKGKGISFMENKKEWHSGYLSAEQADVALDELARPNV